MNIGIRCSRTASVLSAACISISATGASAAAAPRDETYPQRSVRLIVPFPPGGGTDIVARALGARLGEALAQPVVIDNRGGAGGNIGAEIAARSLPDGHTLFMASATQAINMTLYERPGYDLARDFAPISLVATLPYTLVSHPSVPVASVQALVQLARDKPGSLNYASAGSGTGTHLGMEILKSAVKADITHIPYKGSAPAVLDLLAGQVQLMFGNTAAVLPQIRAGKLRALAVSGARRSPLLPDVPTLAETVAPKFEVTQWYGLLAPAGTPPAIVARLNTLVAAITRTSEFRERLSAEGADATSNTPQAYGAFLRAEIQQWAKAVRASGARVD